MDYKEVGLKVGLEIHQQLDGHKLFCKCPCVIRDGNEDFSIKRFLRISASELGDFDPAALHELQKGKYFIYKGYNDINCLVELDESPPEDVNNSALNIALQVCLLLNAKPVDIIQFMRKVVIDGSNVSGFQRTALIGVNGYIDTSIGRVSISTICLEEESAKKIEESNEYRIYNISRLCIPLIEIATSPDIKTPDHAKETAEKIGMVLRSVKGIKRGIGTIRQDVNLSIKNGPRVEIKGFQELRSIPKVVQFEMDRQLALVKSGNKLKPEVRKAEPDLTTSFLRPMPGASRMYPETDVKPIIVDKRLLYSIKIPELIANKVEKIQELFGVSADIAKEIIDNDINIESYVSKYRNLDASLIVRVLIEIPKELKSRFSLDPSKLSGDNFHAVLLLLNENKIAKTAAIDCLAELINTGRINLEKYKTISDSDVEKIIKDIVNNNPKATFSGLMGEAMKTLRGKVGGKKVSDFINKFKK